MKVGSVQELGTLSLSRFRDNLYDTIAPQIQIAINMGFPSHWEYKQHID
jgi:hypothetical protein